MFYLNIVDYIVFFPPLSNPTWDTFLTLRGTQGFYLNHLLPLRHYKSFGVDGTSSYILAQLATSMFSFLLSTWTWDTFLTLRGTQGFYLNNVIPPRHLKLKGGWHSQLYSGTASYMVDSPLYFLLLSTSNFFDK